MAITISVKIFVTPYDFVFSTNIVQPYWWVWVGAREGVCGGGEAERGHTHNEISKEHTES